MFLDTSYFFESDMISGIIACSRIENTFSFFPQRLSLELNISPTSVTRLFPFPFPPETVFF